MRIKWFSFLGANHSWSLVGQNLCREFSKLGHEVQMKSTNGYDYFPEDLKSLIKKDFTGNFDLEMVYTALKNFPAYLNHSKGSKRLGIWSFEFNSYNKINPLPDGFAKFAQKPYCDFLLPPSQFSKEVFLNSGITEDKMKVIPHGIYLEKFKNAKAYPLKTKKSIKILSAIFQPHQRKGLDVILESYGKAFTKKDDVCLVMKIVDKKVEQPFEVSFSQLFNKFKSKYPNHAEVEIVKEFIINIEDLYKSCDIHFCPSKAECFSFPNLEALGSQLINITSSYGGQLDFVNDKNSLLINGTICRAPTSAVYWQSKNTVWFEPDINDCVNKLKFAVDNLSNLKKELLYEIDEYLIPYHWNNIAKKILEI